MFPCFCHTWSSSLAFFPCTLWLLSVMVGLYFLSVCCRYLVFVYDWVYIWRHMYTPAYRKLMVSDVWIHLNSTALFHSTSPTFHVYEICFYTFFIQWFILLLLSFSLQTSFKVVGLPSMLICLLLPVKSFPPWFAFFQSGSCLFLLTKSL